MNDWDGETTAHAAEGPQWVSAAEAADVAGVTPGTVRYWARNGLIVSEVVQGPSGERTLVRLDEVLQHARQGTGGGSGGAAGVAAGGPSPVVTDLPARTSELAPILKSVPEIMAQLTAATDRAARAETKVEFLSAQLAEMRRRLAEAEAGRTATADVVVPEGWDEPPSTEVPSWGAPEEAAAPDEPGAAGWPAPPSEEVAGTPASSWSGTSQAPEPEPGPDSIDWGAGTTGDAEPSEDERGTGAGEVPASGTDRATAGISLDDIWARPAQPREPWPPEAEAPSTTAPGEDGIQWHQPATGTGAEPETEEAAPPPPARRANADIPDETFYGPRRRRWFRRRR